MAGTIIWKEILQCKKDLLIAFANRSKYILIILVLSFAQLIQQYFFEWAGFINV